MTLGRWAFEKGKRGPNESKVTLFIIGTVGIYNLGTLSVCLFVCLFDVERLIL